MTEQEFDIFASSVRDKLQTIRDNLFKSLSPTQRHYLELIICRTCCANSDSEVHQLVVT